ncbi:MAG: phage holin family protein [Marmoricola sp.]
MRLVVWLLVNALALLVAVWLFDGITLHAATRADQVVQLLITGAVFGVISAVVKPVVKLISLPFIILSLGLLLLVINAAMLLLTSHVADSLGLGFHVDGFGTAVLGAIVISLAGMVIEAVLPDGR